MKVRIAVIVLPLAVLLYAFSKPGDKGWKEYSKPEMSAVLKKMEQAYTSVGSFSVTVSYTTYENYETSIKHEESKGYYKKLDKNYHSYLLGIHTYQNEKCCLILDSAKKRITLTNPQLASQVSFSAKEYENLLEECQKIKIAQVDGNETVYRLEYKKTGDISAQEITMDKNNLVTSMVLFYERQIERNGKEEIIKPRLEILFGSYNKQTKINKQEFDESTFLERTDKSYKLKPNYRNFKFYDNRIVK